jgi:hypothetical protein
MSISFSRGIEKLVIIWHGSYPIFTPQTQALARLFSFGIIHRPPHEKLKGGAGKTRAPPGPKEISTQNRFVRPTLRQGMVAEPNGGNVEQMKRPHM